MKTLFKEIKDKAKTSPENERAELAHELIISLDTTDTAIEKVWNVEIKKRVEQIKNGTAKGRPAGDVLADIRAKYS